MECTERKIYILNNYGTERLNDTISLNKCNNNKSKCIVITFIKGHLRLKITTTSTNGNNDLIINLLSLPPPPFTAAVLLRRRQPHKYGGGVGDGEPLI